MAASFLTGGFPEARAWYDHTVVMERILPRLEKEISSVKGVAWSAPLPHDPIGVPNTFAELGALLLLETNSELKSYSASTPREILRLAPEDPDHGFDRDLPDSADPSNDRAFMGGVEGAGSQGFRHMYWSGWDWRRPLATFQIPTRALGQAPDRIDLLAREARERIRNGDFLWGLRILGWTLHYIQDLTQPFHTVQLPSLAMVPWTSALRWPPRAGFEALVAETTRTITNYHWAYEGYVRHALLARTANGVDASPFRECFEKSRGSLLVGSPRELALEVIDQTIARGPETGRALVSFLGTELKAPGISVPLDPSIVDVEGLLANPDIASARTRLNQETCDSLQLASDASMWIVRWALSVDGK